MLPAVKVGGEVTVTEAVAGDELQPAVVTTKLAVCGPVADHVVVTGPADVEVKGVPPGKDQA